MNKKAVYKHLNKLWKKMRQHFKEFTRTENGDELHQFRVQVKKIRSFLTLLEINKKNQQLLKTFKPVKKIFNTAGIIRDASLHVKQAKEHKIKLPEFYEDQDKLQKEETEKLVSKRKKHLKKMKEVKKKLKRGLHPVSPDEIETFFTSQLDNTDRILKKHDFSEQLHNGRKMLKLMMYNEDLAHDGVEKELHINFIYIDKLQDVLGQWHDNKLMLDFFSGKKLGNKDMNSMRTKNGELEKSVAEIAKGFKQKISANGHPHPQG